MWIIGHRGSAGTHPENTLASIDAALAAGVDWIEIDIRLVDGAIIVLHDADLERTTNGTGSVYDLDVNGLRRLDAGGGERIPLLSEVLDRIDARCGLNIEIKQAGLIPALKIELEHTIARQPRWRNKLLLSSFLQAPLREFAAAPLAGIMLAALSDGTGLETLRFAREIRAHTLNVSLAEVTAPLVGAAHDAGLRVLVYTVNETSDVAMCDRIDVDGIFTDYPARAIAFLRKKPII